jgi:hypothetical protein
MPSILLRGIFLGDLLVVSIACALACGIIAYVLIEKVSTAFRTAQLLRLKGRLKSLMMQGDEAMRKECPALLADTSVAGFTEVNRDEDIVALVERDHGLNVCFSASGKINELARAARAYGNKWKRIEAVVGLGYSRTPEGFSALAHALNDRDLDVSYYAMLALARFKSNDAARLLLACISRYPFRGQKIAACLQHFPPTVCEELLRASRMPYSATRFWAVRIMRTFKDPSCLERVIELSSDRSADVRAASCECMGVFRGMAASRIEDALRLRLGDTEWFVRMHAIRAYYAIAGVRARTEIEPHSRDDNWLVREEVRKAMHEDPV